MKELSVPVHKRGQSLLEVLMAMAISIIIIGGLVAAVIVAVRNAAFARNQTLATKYAQEGMELVRVYRDKVNDWSVFIADCTNQAAVGFTAVPSPFTRTLTSCVSPGGDPNKRRVTVTVSWADSAGTHKSELVSDFTKWQ